MIELPLAGRYLAGREHWNYLHLVPSLVTLARDDGVGADFSEIRAVIVVKNPRWKATSDVVVVVGLHS